MIDIFVGIMFGWSVIDGDTVRTDLKVWPNIVAHDERIRLMGVDTPELRGSPDCEKELARRAKTFVEFRLSEGKVVYAVVPSEPGRDSFGRLLGDIIIDGKSLADDLVQQGLGRKYDVEGPWC